MSYLQSYGARPERVLPLQRRGDARVDAEIVIGHRVRVGEVIDEYRPLPAAKIHSGARRSQIGRGQRVKRRVELLRGGVLSRGRIFIAARVLIVNPNERGQVEQVEFVFQPQREGEGSSRLPGRLAALADDGVTLGNDGLKFVGREF